MGHMQLDSVRCLDLKFSTKNVKRCLFDLNIKFHITYSRHNFQLFFLNVPITVINFQEHFIRNRMIQESIILF